MREAVDHVTLQIKAYFLYRIKHGAGRMWTETRHQRAWTSVRAAVQQVIDAARVQRALAEIALTLHRYEVSLAVFDLRCFLRETA